MAVSGSTSTAIGEYLVLGEILKRDLEAYLAHGNTQKGWDIAVVKKNGTKRIQVKTINWPVSKAVNGDFSSFDFLVVVLLNNSHPRSRFFVLTQKEIEPLLSPPNINRKNNKRTIAFSEKFIERNKRFEDAWSKIIN